MKGGVIVIVTILGKEHRKGKSSKTGRDYDFSVIHFASGQRYVEGEAALNKIVGSDILTYDKIFVGTKYQIDTDFDGNIVSMVTAR